MAVQVSKRWTHRLGLVAVAAVLCAGGLVALSQVAHLVAMWPPSRVPTGCAGLSRAHELAQGWLAQDPEGVVDAAALGLVLRLGGADDPAELPPGQETPSSRGGLAAAWERTWAAIAPDQDGDLRWVELPPTEGLVLHLDPARAWIYPWQSDTTSSRQEELAALMRTHDLVLKVGWPWNRVHLRGALQARLVRRRAGSCAYLPALRARLERISGVRLGLFAAEDATSDASLDAPGIAEGFSATTVTPVPGAWLVWRDGQGGDCPSGCTESWSYGWLATATGGRGAEHGCERCNAIPPGWCRPGGAAEPNARCYRVTTRRRAPSALAVLDHAEIVCLAPGSGDAVLLGGLAMTCDASDDMARAERSDGSLDLSLRSDASVPAAPLPPVGNAARAPLGAAQLRLEPAQCAALRIEGEGRRARGRPRQVPGRPRGLTVCRGATGDAVVASGDFGYLPLATLPFTRLDDSGAPVVAFDAGAAVTLVAAIWSDGGRARAVLLGGDAGRGWLSRSGEVLVGPRPAPKAGPPVRRWRFLPSDAPTKPSGGAQPPRPRATATDADPAPGAPDAAPD
jgi:hypothetical protein